MVTRVCVTGLLNTCIADINCAMQRSLASGNADSILPLLDGEEGLIMLAEMYMEKSKCVK